MIMLLNVAARAAREIHEARLLLDEVAESTAIQKRALI